MNEFDRWYYNEAGSSNSEAFDDVREAFKAGMLAAAEIVKGYVDKPCDCSRCLCDVAACDIIEAAEALDTRTEREGRMNELQIAEKWNAQADEYNQWADLSTDEQVEFAFKEGMLAAEEVACNTDPCWGCELCVDTKDKIIDAIERAREAL